jgi:hypothetical protein
MTKRSLYARCRVTLTVAGLIWAPFVPDRVVEVVLSAQGAEPAVPCAACIVLVAAPGQSLLVAEPLNGIEILIDSGTGVANSVPAAMQAIADAGGRPGLLVAAADAFPPLPNDLPPHRVAVRAALGGASIDEAVFRLKTQLVEIRSAAPGALVGIVTTTADWQTLVDRDIASYLDFHSVHAGAPVPPVPASAFAGAAAQTIAPVAGKADAARWMVALPADIVRAREALRDVARSAPVVTAGLVPGGMVDVGCAGRRLATYLDAQSLATVAIAPSSCLPVTISPEVRGAVRVALSTGETIVRVPSAEGHFAEGVRVDARQTLTVREIIARHQAAAARQRRAVQQLISTGTMTLTFEAPSFPAPMAIASRAVIYTAADATDIEQRDIRVNGIAFAGGRVPRLPLIEPERVASPPLAIALTDVYTYRLDGEDTVGGIRCYAVSFSPIDSRRPLFSGTAWIAVDSFAMVKASAVQAALRGPIVSSEQTDEFRPDPEGHWLLARSEVHQIYEGAGFRTPVHRVLAIDRQEVNPPAFDERRRQAYDSTAVMLRDTPQGFRYLIRDGRSHEGEEPKTAGGVPSVPRLAGASQRVRTIALGVIVDPNISTPLPFAGLSYIDFNLFDTGMQVNGFFGGTYGQLAVSVPSLGGTRWQLAGRAFGIASWYNDRAFVQGRERYEWNISQRPAHAAAWVLRPLSSRLTMRAGYELDYTGFDESDSTESTFSVPAAQVSHGLRLALEGQWKGWTSSIWWVGARRGGWRPWGDAAAHPDLVGVGEYRDEQRDYQKAGTALARSFVFSSRLVGRVEGAYMTGWDLDRFSRYTFGSFDNRLRGYPSALIRYDRGAVFRGSAAWSAGRLLRLDGFFDSAYVRDPGFGSAGRGYSGIGAAAEVPAPFGTLVALEWGYGFQGLNSDGRRGTQVVRITGYKIF